eukprot:m51a1_g14753 hypothetical protein (576) ;mRNA; f:325494-327461
MEYLASHKVDHLLFVAPVSKSLMCPVHKGLLIAPVIGKCGHTLCKTCFAVGTTGSDVTCPVDGRCLVADDLIPNLALAAQIDELVVRCRYGTKPPDTPGGQPVLDPTGCPAELPLASVAAHELDCEYAWVECPYSASCPPLRRKDVVAHRRSCGHLSCPHKHAGCVFEGQKDEIEAHLKTCPYEGVKYFIARSEADVQALRKQLLERSEQQDMLTARVDQLSARFDQMMARMEAKTNRIESAIRHLQTSLETTQNHLGEAQQQLAALYKAAQDGGRELVGTPAATFDVHQLNCRGTFSGHMGPVWALAIAGTSLISASSDATVKVWDLRDMKTVKCKATMRGHEGIVHALAVMGNRLFSGSSDKTIRVWDLETYECLRTLTSHDNAICSLAIAAGHLFSGSYQHVKVYDLETFECVKTLDGHNHWVRAMTVSGWHLFSGAYNTIKVWDLGTFTCLRTLRGAGGSMYTLSVVDTKWLLCGNYENAIDVWDISDIDKAEHVRRLAGHIGAVYSLGVSGKRFFSGSYDSTIKVWSSETWQCLQTLLRHTSSVDALAVYGQVLFSGSADMTIKVWSENV